MMAAQKLSEDYDVICARALDWITRQPKREAKIIPMSFPLGRAWFVVSFDHLAKAIEGIEELGIGVFCPRQSRLKTKLGKRVIINDPLFPGYMFAHFDRERDEWGHIEDIKGVLGILKSGLVPSRVNDKLIEHLRNAEAAGVFDFTKPGTAFSAGEQVEITEGPFAGLIAKVRAASPKKRVKLLLQALPIEIDPCYLRKV